jgi:hypothetical protein
MIYTHVLDRDPAGVRSPLKSPMMLKPCGFAA